MIDTLDQDGDQNRLGQSDRRANIILIERKEATPVVQRSSTITTLAKRKTMQIDTRYEALIDKHARIEADLTSELKRPLPDSLVMQRLKRQKLLIRDEIEDWERLMAAIQVTPPRAAAA